MDVCYTAITHNKVSTNDVFYLIYHVIKDIQSLLMKRVWHAALIMQVRNQSQGGIHFVLLKS